MSAPTFGITLRGSSSVAAFREVVARAEALGCDRLAAPDHLGAPDPFTVASAAETERRVDEVRDTAAGRAYRSDALLQVIVIGADPSEAAGRLAGELGSISAEQLLDTPFVLLARDRAHASALIAERHERFGFDSFTTHEPNLEALGAVISAYR